jgi:hypothetical protein
MAIVGLIYPFIVYRVHWLKAKARRDRWAEEVTLLVNEMDWTLGFFEHRASEWHRRVLDRTSSSPSAADGEGCDTDDYDQSHAEGLIANSGGDSVNDSVSDQLSRGRRSYAMRQEQMWLKLAERARDRVGRVKQLPAVSSFLSMDPNCNY